MGDNLVVSVMKCKDYNKVRVRKVILESLKNIDFDLKKLKGKKILIKPNLLSPSKPDLALTTHPVFIEELCKILKENKVKEIYIGDSSAYSTDVALEVCGMNKLKKYAKIINFESEKKKFFNVNLNKVKKIPLPNILFEVDLVVNFAKLKTHGLTGVTLCTKNLYGCIPGKLKENLHREIPDAKSFSVLLNKIEKIISPQLNFIEGVTGIEGEGPGASGEKVKSELFFASKNAGAIDMIASKKIGFNSKKIYTNKNNKVKEKKIIVVGDAKDVQLKFKRPTTYLVSGFFFFLKFLPKPKIVSSLEKCRRCGICVKKCPVNALVLKPNAICNHDKCIRCLCCVEVCPYKAINLEDSLIRKFFNYLVKKLRKY